MTKILERKPATTDIETMRAVLKAYADGKVVLEKPGQRTGSGLNPVRADQLLAQRAGDKATPRVCVGDNCDKSPLSQ